MNELLLAIEGSALAEAMRKSLWLYPIANIGHVLGVATLFGMILAADLRLLGLGRALPLDAVLAFTLPWAIAGLLLALLTGPLLFAPEAVVLAANPFLRLKLLLLVAAGLNALGFHLLRRRGQARPALSAAVSIAIWLLVIICGRAIAYW